jgi:hypothetical protein
LKKEWKEVIPQQRAEQGVKDADETNGGSQDYRQPSQGAEKQGGQQAQSLPAARIVTADDSVQGSDAPDTQCKPKDEDKDFPTTADIESDCGGKPQQVGEEELQEDCNYAGKEFHGWPPVKIRQLLSYLYLEERIRTREKWGNPQTAVRPFQIANVLSTNTTKGHEGREHYYF